MGTGGGVAAAEGETSRAVAIVRPVKPPLVEILVESWTLLTTSLAVDRYAVHDENLQMVLRGGVPVVWCGTSCLGTLSQTKRAKVVVLRTDVMCTRGRSGQEDSERKRAWWLQRKCCSLAMEVRCNGVRGKRPVISGANFQAGPARINCGPVLIAVGYSFLATNSPPSSAPSP